MKLHRITRPSASQIPKILRYFSPHFVLLCIIGAWLDEVCSPLSFFLTPCLLFFLSTFWPKRGSEVNLRSGSYWERAVKCFFSLDDRIIDPFFSCSPAEELLEWLCLHGPRKVRPSACFGTGFPKNKKSLMSLSVSLLLSFHLSLAGILPSLKEENEQPYVYSDN